MRLPSHCLWTICCAALVTACGDDSATAKLAFNNHATALTYAPTTFKMKLIAAYLTEDIDPTTYSNVGITSRFFENEACGGDLKHCDISGGDSEDGTPLTKIVTDFFDFSPGVDVNAALNAQNNPIEATSYKYVRLEFCKYNHENTANIQWGGTFGGDTVTGASFAENSCTVNSAKLDPALTVAAGDSATVTLDYSVANAVTDSGTGANCATAGGHNYCFTLPTFTPSATLD